MADDSETKWALFKQALRRIPGLWYVVGIWFIASFGVSLFNKSGDLSSTATSTIVLLGLAVPLVLLNWIATNQKAMRLPALAFAWGAVVLLMGSVFFNWPAHLRHRIEGSAPGTNSIKQYSERIRECNDSLSDLHNTRDMPRTVEQFKRTVSKHNGACSSVLQALTEHANR